MVITARFATPEDVIKTLGGGSVQDNFVIEWEKKEREAYEIAADHGFHHSKNNFGERVALIHSELSEALDYYRKGEDIPSDHISEFTGVEEEFADVLIRIMDTAAEFGLDVGNAVIAKMKFNESRPFKNGGKKF